MRKRLVVAAILLASCATEPGPPAPPAGVTEALATITSVDFQRKLAALADDSMQGRRAPSFEVNQATAWVAARFREAGLAAGGVNGTFFQNFSVRADSDHGGTVSNVVGVLAGSDPQRRTEAVVFTSHVDHIGVVAEYSFCHASSALPLDTICNGADDNASGTVGVIQLARAFATLRPRPARTLVFAVMNAEELGLIGSYYYVAHPVVPIEQTVAVFNLDMIARNPHDTAGFIGKSYTSLGALVDSIAAAHPELFLTPAVRPGTWKGSSDHYPFAVRNVPALFFCSGIHPDLHTTADNVDRADAGQAARIVRLAFLAALETANRPQRPSWIVSDSLP